MKNKILICHFLQFFNDPFDSRRAVVWQTPGPDEQQPAPATAPPPGGTAAAEGTTGSGPAAEAPRPPETQEQTQNRLRRQRESAEQENRLNGALTLAGDVDRELGQPFMAQNPDLVNFSNYLQNDVDTGLVARLLREYPQVQIVEWTASEYNTKAADFISLDDFPGNADQKRAFVGALRYEPPQGQTPEQYRQTPEYKKWHYAWAHLRVFVEKVRGTQMQYAATTTERAELADTSFGMGFDTVRDGARNIIDKFKQGTLAEKAIIGGTLIFLGKFIWDLLKENPKIKTAAKWGLAAILINYITGKARNDGQTLLNLADVGKRIKDLPRESMIALFAIYVGRERAERMVQELRVDGEKEIYAIEKFGRIDIRNIDRVWRTDQPHSDKAFSMNDLLEMGFSTEEALRLMDGGGSNKATAAYRVVKKLYWFAAKNEFEKLQKREEQARAGRGLALTETERRALRGWEQNASIDLQLLAMSRYLEPNSPFTAFQDVMVDVTMRRVELDGEARGIHGGTARGIITEEQWAAWERGQLPQRTLAGAESALGVAGMYVREGYAWLRDTASTGFQFMRRNFEAGMNRLGIALGTEKTKNFLRDVIPGVTVEMEDNSHLWIFGVLVPYEAVERNGRIDHVMIDGVKVMQMAPEDKEQAVNQIREKAKARMLTAIRYSNVPGLQRLQQANLTWRNGWVIPNGIAVSANARFGIQAGNVEVGVQIDREGPPEHPEVQFFVGRGRVRNFDRIDAEYQRAKVEEYIYAQFPQLSERVTPDGVRPSEMRPAVPVRITRAEEQTGGTLKIEGTIGGMPIDITLAQGEDLQALGPKLREVNLSQVFIDAYLKHIAEDPEFHRPYDDIYHRLVTVTEGWSRVTNAWDRRIWGFIPNGAELLRGPIPEKRALFVLAYKKTELLFLMARALMGKKLGDFGTATAEMQRLYQDGVRAVRHVRDQMQSDYDEAVRRHTSPDEAIMRNFGTYYTEMLMANYRNPDYKNKIRDLINRISDPEFNYLFETLQENVDNSHEIFTRIIAVFVVRTSGSLGHYSQAEHLNPNDALNCDLAIRDIVDNLRRVQSHATGGQLRFSLLEEDAFFQIPSEFRGHEASQAPDAGRDRT